MNNHFNQSAAKRSNSITQLLTRNPEPPPFLCQHKHAHVVNWISKWSEFKNNNNKLIWSNSLWGHMYLCWHMGRQVEGCINLFNGNAIARVKQQCKSHRCRFLLHTHSQYWYTTKQSRKKIPQEQFSKIKSENTLQDSRITAFNLH